MKLRLVNVSDVDEAMRAQLRAWRNSDAVSPFFLLDQVTEEQHRAWLEKNVRGENACACVIYADQVPLGLVYLPWFDRESRQGEIGIYIYNRDFQELRPASFAYEGMMDIAAENLGLKRLCARILEDNAKSIHFHERMGFEFSPEDTGECVKNGERKRVLMYVKDL
ncbi:MAG: GNAT family N-acetyltransferase [Akkermansiaceae bacterium]|nr:GNAT family N-acetyltransferase [Akkermansiaceae bacterium]